MTAIRLALRLGRWGLVGFAGVGFFATTLQAVGFYQVAGRSAEERAAFGRSMSQLGTQFSILLPSPVRPDTVGGYVQFRAFGSLAVLFAIWALVSATAAARGDEERGLVEAVLAAGLSRPRLLAARMGAFAGACFIAALAAGLGLEIGAATGGESVPISAALEAAVVLAALALCCYALTLLVSQFTSARNANAVAGSLLLALFLVNSLSRTFDSLLTWRSLSPFRYYELSRPLSPDGNFDVGATLVLVATIAIAGALAAMAFERRDLRSPLVRLPTRTRPVTYEATASPLWRIPIVRGLNEQRLGLCVWAAGVGALAAVFVVLTKSLVQPLLAVPLLRQYFDSFINGDVYRSFLGFLWFSTAELLLAGFAIAQVARWSTEDTDGRLELVLSNPVSRANVVVERAIVLTLGALFVVAVSGVAVSLEARSQSINVDSSHLIQATLLLVPFTLTFAAVGALIAARIPRATVGLLGGLAFASYLITELGPLFKWPAWAQDLSAFKLYGEPLTNGIDRTGLAIMVFVVVVGFGASMLVMQRRDIGG
jgi:polyether ionophore transport system permease protein